MTTPEEDPGTLEPAPAVTPAAEMERRAFVRRMTTETVGIAGKVFGLSKALSRGAVAAGQAARENFEAVATEGVVAASPDEGTVASAPAPAAESPEPVAEPVVAEPVAAEPVAAPSVAAAPPILPVSPPVPAPSPPVRLSAEQVALLARSTSAVLAVNGVGNPPLAVPLDVHWDGERVRFASLGWSRRSSAIRMDPLLTLVFAAEDSGAFLVVEGRAEVVTGPAVRDAMAPLLSRTGDPGEVDVRWAELTAADTDREVVFVRPTKVLPGRR